ncbi:CopM family metallochaperone [Bartonella tamiae]|uniref:DUF305 domain-containing protein n=1 Tax=Bartonella tamiae Th239 TaxID=1094558 RepID=J1K1R3_9HYPH|nr:DUF305 domain-containing protein [Bartonella tamiae]EJF91000.1 hypothetical protein ME5_00332 [Bartonella tamiae Th239]EJF93335.1 hypothetical protein MEG_01549 [Bartonella tamiae Th307]
MKVFPIAFMMTAAIGASAFTGSAFAQNVETVQMIAQHHKQPNEQKKINDHDEKAQAPSTIAYERANEKMHKNMMVPLTGDADQDFVRSMIPHHKGAIDMAKVVLRYGQDPKIKKLAENVINAQEKEIKEMQDWLNKHSKN